MTSWIFFFEINYEKLIVIQLNYGIRLKIIKMMQRKNKNSMKPNSRFEVSDSTAKFDTFSRVLLITRIPLSAFPCCSTKASASILSTFCEGQSAGLHRLAQASTFSREINLVTADQDWM